MGKEKKGGKMKREQKKEESEQRKTGKEGRSKRSNMIENVKGEGRKIGKEKNIRNKWLNKEKEKTLPLHPTNIKFYAEAMCSVKPPIFFETAPIFKV